MAQYTHDYDPACLPTTSPDHPSRLGRRYYISLLLPLAGSGRQDRESTERRRLLMGSFRVWLGGGGQRGKFSIDRVPGISIVYVQGNVEGGVSLSPELEVGQVDNSAVVEDDLGLARPFGR